ncbi:carbohydrate sulfotransferase 11-like [Lingula anatina]|uniref:Carbohydrate sulfotransferase n=1 Tax=Lingula anatina TaxID=7574 RepID=A0A1S3HA87_LINAN|nr:carbohydrate sulfotransferase 11-like [Lingula anatina]|eukprot:XP_013382381.1 carbohydrate sulfotransferase 11-like [Lingula anatina]
MKTRPVVIRGIAIFTVGIIAWMVYAPLKIGRNDIAVDKHVKETGPIKGGEMLIRKDKVKKAVKQTFPNISETSEANLQAKASLGKAEANRRKSEATWNVSKTTSSPKTTVLVKAETLKSSSANERFNSLYIMGRGNYKAERIHTPQMCATQNRANTTTGRASFTSVYWVDDHHKFIFCEIPKAGCTNWKRIMLLMTCNYNRSYIWSLSKTGVHEGLSNKVLKRLKSFKSRSDSDARLKSYTKVFLTRHPFERLVSFFREKLQRAKNDHYDRKISSYVLRSIHKKQNVTHKMVMEYNVTFPEYIQYVIDTKKHPDIHWGIQHSLCHPCSVDYDVIGRYETIVEDSNNLLKMLGIDEITYPQSDNVDFAKYKTKDLVSKHFKTLKPWMIKELQTMYKTDADIFGYDLDLK